MKKLKRQVSALFSWICKQIAKLTSLQPPLALLNKKFSESTSEMEVAPSGSYSCTMVYSDHSIKEFFPCSEVFSKCSISIPCLSNEFPSSISGHGYGSSNSHLYGVFCLDD